MAFDDACWFNAKLRGTSRDAAFEGLRPQWEHTQASGMFMARSMIMESLYRNGKPTPNPDQPDPSLPPALRMTVAGKILLEADMSDGLELTCRACQVPALASL